MRILIYTEDYLHKTCTFIYNEIEELAKYNEVMVVYRYPFNDTKIPNVDLTKQVSFAEGRITHAIKYRMQNAGFAVNFSNKSFANQLDEAVKSFKPDVIHSHFGTHSLKVVDNLRHLAIPIFISFHGYDASMELENKSYRTKLNQIFSRPNVHPIFVSNFMRKSVEKKLGQSVPRFNILYYGTDIDKFQRQQYDTPREQVTFLQVSSFRGKKGHPYTLKAYKKFREAHPEINSKLILGGHGDIFDEIQQLTKDLGLWDHVEFPGFMGIPEVKKLMENAHVFVHHSVTTENKSDMEGIPNALMEAMAMELPVLATYHSGIPELIETGVNGFLAEERDVDTYAEQMYQISSWNYKKENREKIATLFEKKTHRKLLEGFYKKAITKNYTQANT